MVKISYLGTYTTCRWPLQHEQLPGNSEKSIPIYASPGGEQLVNLKEGEIVELLTTDNKENILLQNEEGL